MHHHDVSFMVNVIHHLLIPLHHQLYLQDLEHLHPFCKLKLQNIFLRGNIYQDIHQAFISIQHHDDTFDRTLQLFKIRVVLPLLLIHHVQDLILQLVIHQYLFVFKLNTFFHLVFIKPHVISFRNWNSHQYLNLSLQVQIGLYSKHVSNHLLFPYLIT